MTEISLTGLDGKNPLAFLAALGTLSAVTDRAEGESPKLRWHLEGTYRPALAGAPERHALVALLDDDRRSLLDEPALVGLRYEKAKGGLAHDLKPPPARYREFLRDLVERGSPRSLAFVAAFATDVARDNNGNTKPTALHFTAGQQEFLDMVHQLARDVTAADLEEALFGPWRYERPLPVLQWDNAVSRDYALRASDPSKERKLGTPGADWLAFRGLPFIGVAPVGRAIATTGCRGGWKDGAFRWPLWGSPLARPVVGALLRSSDLFDADPASMRARGILAILESDIRRSDQGGYGSFSPSRIAGPVRKP